MNKICLPKRLKQLRVAYDLRQGEFAELFDTTQQAVSAWESGKSAPDYQTLMKIADYFCVSLDYLLGRKTEEQQKKESEDDRSFLDELFSDDPETLDVLKNARVRNGTIHRNGTLYTLSEDDRGTLKSIIRKYIRDMMSTGKKAIKIKRE